MAVLKVETLYFGSGAAESETDLEKVFIETPEFKDILTGRYNLVIGNKGSGKTAMYTILSKSPIPKTIVIPLSSTDGSVEHNKLFKVNSVDSITIDEFRERWKKYIAVRIAHFMISHPPNKEASEEFEDLKNLLTEVGVTEQLINAASTINHLNDDILEKIIEFIKNDIDYTTIMSTICSLLEKWDMEAWVTIDRLDETILSSNRKQMEAIDALLPVIKDFSGFKKIKIIIFLREDMFRQLQYPHKDHFYSTTRILRWNKENLLYMIVKRILLNYGIKQDFTFEKAKEIFYWVFEKKIPSSNAKDSFEWIYNHLMDGHETTNPRDVVLMGNQCRDEQLSAKFATKNAIISGTAIVRAQKQVAASKFDDLQRIYPETKKILINFSNDIVKDSYGRINKQHFTEIFSGKSEQEIEGYIRLLLNVGFLKPENKQNPMSSQYFDIPYVYKTPLGIKSTGAKKTKKK
ncbi:MAG: hypothetical protein Q8R04_05280 [Nanoarchaeota archaeon]|nr:hypothetical protein [Nanoarchaeota archaeon]